VTGVTPDFPSGESCFNPHSRKGSDVYMGGYAAGEHEGFNPHSRKGSDIYDNAASLKDRGFNPHSRKGSDIEKSSFDFVKIVSIHTPARGVTGL